MLVLLKSAEDYSFGDQVNGQKVIARKGNFDNYEVAVSELHRVGLVPDSYLEYTKVDYKITFFSREVDEVKPKLVNCTDKNIGKGWA